MHSFVSNLSVLSKKSTYYEISVKKSVFVNTIINLKG